MNIFDIMFFFFFKFPFFSEVNIKRILLARIYLLKMLSAKLLENLQSLAIAFV